MRRVQILNLFRILLFSLLNFSFSFFLFVFTADIIIIIQFETSRACCIYWLNIHYKTKSMSLACSALPLLNRTPIFLPRDLDFLCSAPWCASTTWASIHISILRTLCLRWGTVLEARTVSLNIWVFLRCRCRFQFGQLCDLFLIQNQRGVKS